MTSYHHGDLRAALLDAAREVLATEGVAALSLRDLARRVGVSPTAPYHHFRGKADLIHALAEDALATLDEVSERALVGLEEPGQRLQALGVAYVLFAVDHPESFRLAFRPEMGGPFAGLAHDAEALPRDTPGFRLLLQVVAEAREKGLEWGPDAIVALRAWGLVHGLAALLVDGPLRPLAADRARVEALVREITGGAGPGG
jgi:AcrR family transcriptional regulator